MRRLEGHLRVVTPTDTFQGQAWVPARPQVVRRVEAEKQGFWTTLLNVPFLFLLKRSSWFLFFWVQLVLLAMLSFGFHFM